MTSIESILQSMKYVIFDRKKNKSKKTFLGKKEYNRRVNYNITQFALQCLCLNLSIRDLSENIKWFVADYKHRQDVKKELGLIVVKGGMHITNASISAHLGGYISGLICFYCI